MQTVTKPTWQKPELILVVRKNPEQSVIYGACRGTDKGNCDGSSGLKVN